MNERPAFGHLKLWEWLLLGAAFPVSLHQASQTQSNEDALNVGRCMGFLQEPDSLCGDTHFSRISDDSVSFVCQASSAPSEGWQSDWV